MKYINNLRNIFYSSSTYGSSRTSPMNRGSMFITPNKFTDYAKKTRVKLLGNEDIHFMGNLIEGYYVPMVTRAKIGARTFVSRNDQKNIYRDIKQKHPTIKYTHQKMIEYNKRNIIFDEHYFLSLTMGKVPYKTNKDLLDYFKMYIEYVLENTPGYENRYIVFDLSERASGSFVYTNDSMILEANFRKINDIFDMFLYCLKFYPEETLDYIKDFILVFASSKGIVKLDVTEYLTELNSDKNTQMPSKDKLIRILLIQIKKTYVGSSEDIESEPTTIADDINKALDGDVEGSQEAFTKTISKLSDHEKEDSEKISAIEYKINSKYKSKEDIAIVKAAGEKIVSEINREIKTKEKYMTDKELIILNNAEEIDVDVPESKKIIDTPAVFNITSLDDLNENTYIKIDEVYDKEMKAKYTKEIMQHFTKCSTPLYVQDIQINDISDEQNYIDEYRVQFKDSNGVSNTIRFKVPKLIEGKFFYLGGNKSTLLPQWVANPIVKVGEDVIVTTNYNKLFITHKNNKYLTPNESRIFRAIDKLNSDGIKGVEFGDYSVENLQTGMCPLEYIRMSKKLLSVKNGDLDLVFKYDESIKRWGDNYQDHLIKLGTYKNDEIFIDRNNGKILYGEDSDGGETLDDFIINVSRDNLTPLHKSLLALRENSELEHQVDLSDLMTFVAENDLDDVSDIITDITSVPKRVATTCVKLLGRWVPMIFILMYTEGLFSVLRKASIEFDVTYKIDPKHPDKKNTKPKYDKYKQLLIECSDAYMTVEYNNIETITLLSALTTLDLKDYKISSLESKTYMSTILEGFTSSNNFSLYVDNYKDLLIDPITRDTLRDNHLPTTFDSVLLYSNSLLATGKNSQDIDLSQKRLRHKEIVEALVYDSIANAYSEYSVKKKRGNVKDKFEVPPNSITKSLHELNTMENYSTLNPVNELTKYYTSTMKGHSGINMDRAYTIEKRVAHKSFYGTVAMTSVYNGGVGVTKQTTLDPYIDFKGNTVDSKKEINDMSTKRLLGITELSVPLSANHDSPERVFMNLSQNNHTVPIKEADPLLVTYGFDEMMAHMTADFAINSKLEGKVVAIDENAVTLQYIDGSKETHMLSTLERNSAKSFYIQNDFKTISKLEVGYEFKKNEILAYNKEFFKDINGDIIYTPGRMVNVAIHSAPELYEDSTLISESMSRELETAIIKRYAVKIDCKSSIKQYAMIGEELNASDKLISYSEATEDDILDAIFDSSVMDIGSKELKNKAFGHVAGIKIYMACEPSDLSETITEFAKRVDLNIQKTEKVLEKHGTSFDKNVKSNRVKIVTPETKIGKYRLSDGEILIEYFVSSPDAMSIGDKGTYYSAVKGIVAAVLPDDKMPVGEISGQVHAMLSSMGVGARKVYSIYLAGCANKALKKLGSNLQNMFLDD